MGLKEKNITEGARVNVYVDGRKIIVEPLQDDLIQEGQDMLETGGLVLKALMADRVREAEK